MHTEPQTKDSSLYFSLRCANVTMSRNQTSSSSVLNNYIFTVHQLPTNQSYTISFCGDDFCLSVFCVLCRFGRVCALNLLNMHREMKQP